MDIKVAVLPYSSAGNSSFSCTVLRFSADWHVTETVDSVICQAEIGFHICYYLLSDILRTTYLHTT